MDNIIQFSREQTLFLYYLSIMLATFFAYLSEMFPATINGKTRVNKYFWVISFICLFIPLAFRGYGIDNESYKVFFNSINKIGYRYNGFPEPLFTLLNFIVGLTLKRFNYVYIISAFLSLLFIYIGLSKRIGKSSLAMCVWLLCVSYYFYMFGLVRMFLAVGVLVFAHQYIEQKKMYKYFFWCLVAASFHYSALIMLPLYFIFIYKNKKIYTWKSTIVNMFVAILCTPVIFYIGSKVFMSTFGQFYFFSRYTDYFEVNFNLASLKNVAWIWPLIIIILFLGKDITYKIEDGHLILRMFWVMVGLSVISTLFPIYRLTFFMFYIGFYLYASISKLKFKSKEAKTVFLYLFNCGMLILGIFYIHSVFFDSIFIDPYLIPYYFNFP